MKIRIPRPVNRGLDAVTEHPRAAVVAVVVGAVVLPVIAVWVSPPVAVFIAVTMAAYTVGARYRLRIQRLEEQVRQAEYDLAAERAENARLRAGDPSAPTAQLRQIGEAGELL